MPLMLISTLTTAADLCETGKCYFADLGCKGGPPAWPLTVPYPRLPIWLQACLSACLLVYKSMIVTHVNLKHIVTTWIQYQWRTCVLGASSGLQCLQILRYTSTFNNPPKLESGLGRCVTATCDHIHGSVHNSPVLCTIDKGNPW